MILRMNQSQRLTELINALTCNELQPAEVEGIVKVVLQAQSDPEQYVRELELEEDEALDWLLEIASSKELMSWALCAELQDFLFISDKVDELHEQIQTFFEKDSLLDYPYDQVKTSHQYFAWLDHQLQRVDSAQGGYTLLMIGDSYGDELQAIAVYRKDLKRVLDLCAELEIQASNPVSI
jgi:hypothetical protein